MQTGVITPNHNYSEWIKESIESVLYQTSPPTQYIIIDDGSTDNSVDVISKTLGITLESWSGDKQKGETVLRDVKITAVSWPKPQGPSFARNYAIGLLSKNKQLDAYSFLDSDDYYKNTFLEETVSILSADSQYIGVVYTDSYINDISTNNILPKYWEPFSREKLVEGNRLSMNSLVNRKAIDTCGMFDTTLRTLEDWDLWMRISEKFVLIHLPELLVVQRNHSNNSLSTVAKERWEENYQKVIQKAYDRMGYVK